MTKTNQPQIRHRGGLRMDGINITWPFAILVASEQEIELSYFNRGYRLQSSQVRFLKRHRGFFSVGLKIVHDAPHCPSELVFWSFEYDKLRQAFERLGYDVK